MLRKSLNWYAKLSPARGKTLPPYTHVVQIGDPTLRQISEPVPLENIKTDKIQEVIKKLNYVMIKHGSVGMAAPQIGVNFRIFVMRVTSSQISNIDKSLVQLRKMTVVPHTVFVNPKMTVVNFQKVVLPEGCESFKGYAADVPRFREVQITGYNENGESTTTTFKDWTARIAQHELDHLDGKVYVDIMDRKTLHCVCWEEINLSKGKVVIPMSPD